MGRHQASKVSYQHMSHGAKLRRMLNDDIASIMEIEQRAYPHPWTQGIFEDCLRVGYACWVLEREINNQKTIIGYMVLSIAVDEMHILNLCIDPKIQGQGIGRALLLDAQNYGKKNNAAMCFLEVRPSNKAAVNLYLSEGFNEVGFRKNYYRDDNGKREDAIVMAKDLLFS